METSKVFGRFGFVGVAAVVLVVALLAVAPAAVGSFELSIINAMMIYAIFAISLNLLVGYTGIASLGHAAFFGAGGYTVALLWTAGIGGFWLPLLLAMVVSFVLAAALGALTLRAHGAYQLMITLALAQVLWGIAYGWRDVTGGDDGIPGIAIPVALPGLSPQTAYYFVVWLFFVGVTVASWLFVSSPFGRSLVGIRESERRMRALGYNVWLHKIIVYMIAGAIAGLAGALLAWHNGFVAPTYLSVTKSAVVLIMVIVGGGGTVIGPVLGAFLIVGLESAVSTVTERWVLILGIVYILTSLFAPNGVIGILRKFVRKDQ